MGKNGAHELSGMFFMSPLFPRLLNPDILKDTIAKGASNGLLGYVGQKVEQKISMFYYQKPYWRLMSSSQMRCPSLPRKPQKPMYPD
jgi:hypothetical protein